MERPGETQVRSHRCLWTFSAPGLEGEEKITDLELKLQKFTESKTVGGRISEEWLLRTILTAPHVSGRALAETFLLSVGSDSNVICREKIGAVRSAFLEMWKNMVFLEVRNFVAAHFLEKAKHMPAATGAGTAATSASITFLPLVVSHVQDEADMRLLTMNPESGPRLPRRSRSSKVQVNVMSVGKQGRSWDLSHESVALADKTATKLATCVEALVQVWCD